jgi:hypothetical protein
MLGLKIGVSGKYSFQRGYTSKYSKETSYVVFFVMEPLGVHAPGAQAPRSSGRAKAGCEDDPEPGEGWAFPRFILSTFLV